MKKLILISALLFLVSNVYANDLPTDGAFQIPHANGKLYLKGKLRMIRKREPGNSITTTDSYKLLRSIVVANL